MEADEVSDAGSPVETAPKHSPVLRPTSGLEEGFKKMSVTQSAPSSPIAFGSAPRTEIYGSSPRTDSFVPEVNQGYQPKVKGPKILSKPLSIATRPTSFHSRQHSLSALPRQGQDSFFDGSFSFGVMGAMSAFPLDSSFGASKAAFPMVETPTSALSGSRLDSPSYGPPGFGHFQDGYPTSPVHAGAYQSGFRAGSLQNGAIQTGSYQDGFRAGAMQSNAMKSPLPTHSMPVPMRSNQSPPITMRSNHTSSSFQDTSFYSRSPLAASFAEDAFPENLALQSPSYRSLSRNKRGLENVWAPLSTSATSGNALFNTPPRGSDEEDGGDKLASLPMEEFVNELLSPPYSPRIGRGN